MAAKAQPTGGEASLDDFLTAHLLHEGRAVTARHLCRIRNIPLSEARDGIKSFYRRHRQGDIKSEEAGTSTSTRFTAWFVESAGKPKPHQGASGPGNEDQDGDVSRAGSARDDDTAMMAIDQAAALPSDWQNHWSERPDLSQRHRARVHTLRLVSERSGKESAPSPSSGRGKRQIYGLTPASSSSSSSSSQGHPRPDMGLALLAPLAHDEFVDAHMLRNWERSGWGVAWGVIDGGVKERIKVTGGTGASTSGPPQAPVGKPSGAAAVGTTPKVKTESNKQAELVPKTKSEERTSTSAAAAVKATGTAKSSTQSTKKGVTLDWGKAKPKAATSSSSTKRKARIQDSEDDEEDDDGDEGGDGDDEEREQEDSGGALGLGEDDGVAGEAPAMDIDTGGDVRSSSGPRGRGRPRGSTKAEGPDGGADAKPSAARPATTSESRAHGDVEMRDATEEGGDVAGGKEGGTAPRRRVRKQRKVTRKEKSKNERGYWITKDVEAYESYSSDESSTAGADEAPAAAAAKSSRKPGRATQSAKPRQEARGARKSTASDAKASESDATPASSTSTSTSTPSASATPQSRVGGDAGDSAANQSATLSAAQRTASSTAASGKPNKASDAKDRPTSQRQGGASTGSGGGGGTAAASAAGGVGSGGQRKLSAFFAKKSK